LDLAKYLGEGTSRKEAEEKSSAFFIGGSFLSSGREAGTAMDKIWQRDPPGPVNFCQPIRGGNAKDFSSTGSVGYLIENTGFKLNGPRLRAGKSGPSSATG
jgi:hypothetical protein